MCLSGWGCGCMWVCVYCWCLQLSWIAVRKLETHGNQREGTIMALRRFDDWAAQELANESSKVAVVRSRVFSTFYFRFPSRAAGWLLPLCKAQLLLTNDLPWYAVLSRTCEGNWLKRAFRFSDSKGCIARWNVAKRVEKFKKAEKRIRASFIHTHAHTNSNPCESVLRKKSQNWCLWTGKRKSFNAILLNLQGQSCSVCDCQPAQKKPASLWAQEKQNAKAIVRMKCN